MNLNQVSISSQNVEKAIVFYETLGLRLIVRDLPYYARFECLKGDSTLSIMLTDTALVGKAISLYFEVEFLDDYVNSLIQKGILFDEMPEDKSWLWREARLKDPDHNKLVLYYAGKNRKNPPWKV